MESTLQKKFLNLEEKMLVVKKLNDGVSIRKITEEFCCGKTQIANIHENKESVKRQWEAGVPSKNKTLKKRKTDFEEINFKFFEWFSEARLKNLPVSGPMVKEKAIVIAVDCIGCENFMASTGWLRSWQKQFGITFVQLAGEAADVDEKIVDDWKKRLPEITSGFLPENIFNADETGIKTVKKRLTVLLACSQTGEKLPPLVIGYAENPRCFKGRKILLFVDNCFAHPEISMSNVIVKYLPPKTTSCLQPLDAGIISQIKTIYRKRENRNTDVQLIEADPTITSLLGSVTWENFVTMDNNDDSIHSPQSSENHEQFEVQDDEEEEEVPVQDVSTKMALQCARKLTSYSIHMGIRELLQFSENIENILEIELLKTKCFGKQTTMNDFLP
ncbi:hypothetical protein HELRODRAFT_183752 [Helobdella robusta]|uniref:HTH CENPB-type domain-containing protein n=1 Tax=Helobdella robusta TaxID=6412 RepID=T1FK53_HELRO|nr:hypothetical protein HELRODRAFT_183752 [Helobdella robusta]ESO10336.1 hypothetical protein HELRODRAFT_183752 [Helobdella robusta]